MNDAVQVGFHQIQNNVNIVKLFQVGWRLQNILNGDDVIVFEMCQDLELSVRSFGSGDNVKMLLEFS